MTGQAREQRPSPDRARGRQEIPPGRRESPPARREDPVLPEVSKDETDVGWGDEPAGRDDHWYRRERPPHHE
jgi:hypothetical protein